jgi:soluble lytic murein transglycosylase-like protein
MKAICIATVLAVVSTPALARNAHHHKSVRHLHRHVEMMDAWQRFAGPLAAPERWDAQPRAPRIAADASPGQGAYAEMVARHAAANGLPASLVHRVIMRESRYNPRAVSKGNYGMMQIRLGTARTMGYTGTASGLLDPEVNMTYAVKYLAGAYQAAGGSEGGGVANYARGYYRQARRQSLSPYETPGSAAFAMQVSPRGVHASRGDFEMAADRHAVF